MMTKQKSRLHYESIQTLMQNNTNAVDFQEEMKRVVEEIEKKNDILIEDQISISIFAIFPVCHFSILPFFQKLSMPTFSPYTCSHRQIRIKTIAKQKSFNFEKLLNLTKKFNFELKITKPIVRTLNSNLELEIIQPKVRTLS